jgi:hypothetical protein
MTSSNGITWSSRTSAADNDWNSIAYGNGLYVAVSSTGTGNRVMTSSDGAEWSIQSSNIDSNWYGITYNNDTFVAVARTANNSTEQIITGKRIPIITFTVPSPKTFGDASFALTDLTSSSPGKFIYESSNAKVVEARGNMFTIVGAGNTNIIVRQDACGNYTDASENQLLVVNQATTVITNFTIPTKTFGDAPFTLQEPSSNSPATFRYNSSNLYVATISDKTITITGAGTSTITAIQDACGNYTDASANTIFVVNNTLNPTLRIFLKFN